MPSGSNWATIEEPSQDLLSTVSAGKSVTMVTTENGEVYIRTGISEDEPVGTNWTRMAGNMSMVGQTLFLSLSLSAFPFNLWG